MQLSLIFAKSGIGTTTVGATGWRVVGGVVNATFVTFTVGRSVGSRVSRVGSRVGLSLPDGKLSTASFVGV